LFTVFLFYTPVTARIYSLSLHDALPILGASGIDPTLRRSAKDGAPGLLWLVECGRAWWAGGLHPTLRRSAKDGAPGFCWLVEGRSEEHTSELQSLRHLVCRLLLEKKNTK